MHCKILFTVYNLFDNCLHSKAVNEGNDFYSYNILSNVRIENFNPLFFCCPASRPKRIISLIKRPNQKSSIFSH